MGDILFLIHRIPWPPDRGDKIRSHWILRHMAAHARVHVGCFTDDARDAEYIDAMAAVTASQHVEPRSKPMWRAGGEALLSGRPVSITAFDSAAMHGFVADTLSRHPIDRIVIFSGQMAQYVPRDFAGKLIIDFVDVDSAKFDGYARNGNPLMRWVNAREGRKLAAFEAMMARRADASLFVSAAEAALFVERSGIDDGRAQPLGNGIAHDVFDPMAADIIPVAERPGAPLLVFTGQMDYRPNIEAVDSFAHDVLPAIRAVYPNATFAIVGRAPTPAVQALSALPGVVVTGAVDDVRGWLAAADLIVAPLRLARGIQNKVLEAMAMARPVLASSAAAEGIEAIDGTHFVVAATPAEEAKKALALLADPARCAAMGAAARAHVVARYGWTGALAPLDALLGLTPPVQDQAA